MRSHFLLRLVQVSVLCAAVSATALAQYGGGTGSGITSTPYTAPSGGYGNGKAIGIGVGVAAAVVGIALYVHHRHKAAKPHASLNNWSQPAQNWVRVTNVKDYRNYSEVALKPDLTIGERVDLTGKETQDGSGKKTFQVQKLAKDYGPLKTETAVNASSN